MPSVKIVALRGGTFIAGDSGVPGDRIAGGGDGAWLTRVDRLNAYPTGIASGGSQFKTRRGGFETRPYA